MQLTFAAVTAVAASHPFTLLPTGDNTDDGEAAEAWLDQAAPATTVPIPNTVAKANPDILRFTRISRLHIGVARTGNRAGSL